MCKVFAAQKNSRSLSRKYCIRRFKPVFKTFSTLVLKVRINLRLVNCRIMKKFQFLIILKASILTWRVIRGTYERQFGKHRNIPSSVDISFCRIFLVGGGEVCRHRWSFVIHVKVTTVPASTFFDRPVSWNIQEIPLDLICFRNNAHNPENSANRVSGVLFCNTVRFNQTQYSSVLNAF